MKICNCGYQNDDTDNFCKQCGSPLEAQQQTTPPPMAETVPPMAGQQVAPPPMTSGYAQPTNDVQQPAANPFPMLSALKEKGGSAGFLIATILFTLSLVMTIVSAFSIGGQLYEIVNMINAYVGMGMTEAAADVTEIYNVVNQMAPVLTVISFLSSIPTIIICIGLWCIYGTCKKSGNQPLKTGGFTAIKVIFILNMIGTCISYAFIVFMFAFIFLAAAAEGVSMSDLMYSLEMAGSMGYGDAEAIAGIIAGAFGFIVVLLIVVMVLSIIYLAKIIGCLNRAKEIIVTGKTSKNVSAFVGVFLMLGGIGNALGGLISLDIATILSGVTSIIFASLLFSIRGAINRAR